MKSAEELAEECWQHLHKGLFVDLLNAFADVRLEEAAKLLEDAAGGEATTPTEEAFLFHYARRIRALQSSGPRER